MIYELTAPGVLIKKEPAVDPGSAEPASVRATTLFSAISTGTELAAWTGKPPLRPSNPYPRLVGYSNVARVESVGSSVRDVAQGDVILTHQSHRSGFTCGRRDVLLNIGKVDVPMQKLLSTVYLYHLGYAALLGADYRPGAEVAVVGLGLLGFTTASLVSAYGGSPAVFSGRSQPEALLKYVPHARGFRKRHEPAPMSWNGLDGADIVVNTSDSWDDYELSLSLVRRGGIVMLLGFPGRGLPVPRFNPLDSRYIYDKSITLRQAGHMPDLDAAPEDVRFTLKRNLAHLFSLLRAGRLDPTPITENVIPAGELQRAYQFLEQRPERALSVILDWLC